MPTYAIISDIHANLEALTAVLHDLEARHHIPKERICSLGDNIGYGPNPVEVLELLQGIHSGVRGNHEDMLCALAEQKNISEMVSYSAEMTIRWTYERLREQGMLDEALRFPVTSVLEERALLVHGSPKGTEEEKIVTYIGSYGENASVELFENFSHICFVGHTHQQNAWLYIHDNEHEVYDISNARQNDLRLEVPVDMPRTNKRFTKKYILNPGSVGFARDGIPDACYILYDTDAETVRFFRIPYDSEMTMCKLESIHGDDAFGICSVLRRRSTNMYSLPIPPAE